MPNYKAVATFNTPSKNLVRELAIAGATGSTGLFLPSSEALCVRYAAKHTKLKSLVCCEQEPKRAKALFANVMASRTLQGTIPIIHPGSVQGMDPHAVRFHYMFLDLCGSVSQPLAAWLAAQKAHRTEIAITLTRCWRSSAYMQAVSTVLKGQDAFMDQCVSLACPAVRLGADSSLTPMEFSDCNRKQLAMLHLIFAGAGLSFSRVVNYGGASGSGIPMTMFRFFVEPKRLGLRRSVTLAAELVKKLTRRKKLRPELVQHACEHYANKKWTPLRQCWRSATAGQRAAISKRCGESLYARFARP